MSASLFPLSDDNMMRSASSHKPIEVFFSYSHKDEKLRDKLADHLSILTKEGVINAWYDRDISAGTEWAEAIDDKLNSANIILLLISANFLASRYCYSIEMQRALERHEAKEARVIPIILKPVDWNGAPFGKLQAFPKNAKPVTLWKPQDEAFVDIAKGIRKAVQKIITPQPPDFNSPPLLGGQFYIERPSIEQQCYQEITKNGALIRIKAPQKMGKTWLMNRIFDYAATQQGYRTVFFDLLEPEEEVIADLDQFLRYFCSAVSGRLGLTDRVDEFWQKQRSKTLKCRTYFEQEILTHLDSNLVLGLDNVDRIFAPRYSLIASDFFGMLRSWYNNGQILEKWKKLRIILVYSTDDLPYLGNYQSPFNVGE